MIAAAKSSWHTLFRVGVATEAVELNLERGGLGVKVRQVISMNAADGRLEAESEISTVVIVEVPPVSSSPMR